MNAPDCVLYVLYGSGVLNAVCVCSYCSLGSGPGLGLESLTVGPQKVIEQLEEREAVPAVRGLNLQCSIHVHCIQRQEGLGMLHHQV